MPNAKVIDALLVHLNANPDAWNAAWDAAWDAAWYAAWDAARDAARDAAWHAVWHATWYAAWDAARDATRYAVRDAARGVLLALVAYDDCAHILDLSESEATTLGLLGNNAAVLLLPAIKAGFKCNQ